MGNTAVPDKWHGKQKADYIQHKLIGANCYLSSLMKSYHRKDIFLSYFDKLFPDMFFFFFFNSVVPFTDDFVMDK